MTSNKLELSPAEQKVLKQKKARKAKDILAKVVSYTFLTIIALLIIIPFIQLKRN